MKNNHFNILAHLFFNKRSYIIRHFLIFLKRLDPPNMVRFATGLKSIGSALLNIVEFGHGTRQIGSILGYTSNHQLHASYLQLMMPTTNVTSTHLNSKMFLVVAAT